MLFQLLLMIFIIWLLVIQWQKKRTVEFSKQLGNDIKTLPFVGHAHLLLGSNEDRMKTFQLFSREAIKQGGVTTFWMTNKLYLIVADPLIAEFIMKTCLEKDDVMKYLRNVIGNGTIFAPVPIWRPRRKVLLPSFSPKILNQFEDIFSKQSSIMVHQLRPKVGGGPFSIWKYLTTYTMDAICETNLGVSINAQMNHDQPFLEAFDQVCQLITARMCQPWLYNEAVYKLLPYYKKFENCKKVLYDFVDQVIKSKREDIKEKDNNHTQSSDANNKDENGFKTFLELIIESSGVNGGYSDLELREETLVITVAGTDTSAVGACFVIVMMSRHLDVQDKVFEELNEVFGDSDRPIVAEDLPRLKYLDVVIKETLRLYTPVPIIARKVEKDIQLPSGINLVAGTGVILSIWALHRNPRYWGPDAEQFKPERFLDNPLKHPAAFIPFSYGPRNCLGYQYAMMSMKTAVAAILRKYRILPPEMSDATPENKNKPLRVKFDIMMKDVNNFTVRLESRV